MSSLIRAFCACLLVFLCTLPVAAATTGMVGGRVDIAGTPQTGVLVTLDGGSRHERTLTNAMGMFMFPRVPFGHYTLTAHFEGYQDESRVFDLASGQMARFMLTLVKEGALKSIVHIHVVSSAQASGTPVSQNEIGRSTLQTLPNNTSLNRVVETLPGIVRFSYNEPVAHGFHGITYEIDGAPTPVATSSNFAEIIDPRNVDAIEVYTGAMPAEFGGSRAGAVVNIVTDRNPNLLKPFTGHLSVGIGNQRQASTSLSTASRLAGGALFLNLNANRTARGLDAPTFTPINDTSSQSDQFARYVRNVGKRGTISLDASNQLSLFQIPINTDLNNPNDPVVSVPGTQDVQIERDRFANIHLSLASAGGNAAFDLIPWVRSSRITYLGDLGNDVLATQPNPNPPPTNVNLVGLNEDRAATYVGLRASNSISSPHHYAKFGLDLAREYLHANQTLAQLGLPNTLSTQQQIGTQIGIYGEDQWNPSRAISVSYGLRYDKSTGYTFGQQFSPRIGLNAVLDPKDILHLYYGRFYAAPQLEDVRQACVVLQGCPTTPVYDLQPEHDSYYEAGVHHTFSPLISGYVNIWRRNVANVLDTTQLLNTPIFAVYNNTVGQAAGLELRLQGRTLDDRTNWFVSGSWSASYAGGISGSTFLFGGAQPTYPLQPEDHDQTVAISSAFTRKFGVKSENFATFETDFGTGYPVQFQNGPSRLPTHIAFDIALGHTPQQGLGYTLAVDNILNHQYVIKISNGFNTTQIANGRRFLFTANSSL